MRTYLIGMLLKPERTLFVCLYISIYSKNKFNFFNSNITKVNYKYSESIQIMFIPYLATLFLWKDSFLESSYVYHFEIIIFLLYVIMLTNGHNSLHRFSSLPAKLGRVMMIIINTFSIFFIGRK